MSLARARGNRMSGVAASASNGRHDVAAREVRELLRGTLDFLKTAAPRLSISRRETPAGLLLDLPAPDGAQYRISLLAAEPRITATLFPPLDDKVFWSWAFGEEYGTLDRREAEFFRCAGLFLACPTRIVQRRGVLGTRFCCDAKTNEGYLRVGERVGPVLSISAPEIRGRERTYRSPAVLSASTAANGREDR